MCLCSCVTGGQTTTGLTAGTVATTISPLSGAICFNLCATLLLQIMELVLDKLEYLELHEGYLCSMII